SYSGGAFQMQWREDFTASGPTAPSGWTEGNWASALNHSMRNTPTVNSANGSAVLSMTAENATGFTGTPPADPAGGTGGTSGSGGPPGAGRKAGRRGAAGKKRGGGGAGGG